MMDTESKERYGAADFMRYHNGEMSDKEMQELEERALQDPFLADALEGWSRQTDAGLVNEVEKALDMGAGGSSSSQWNWKPIFIGIGAVILLFSGVKIVQNVNSVNDMLVEVIEEQNAIEPPFIISPSQDSIDEMEIKLSVPLPVAEHIDIEKVSIEMKEGVEQEEVPGSNELLPDLEPIPIKVEDTIDQELEVKLVKQEKPDIYFLYDLKVADYRAIRADEENSIAIWTVLSSHVPARFENDSVARRHSPTYSIDKVPYTKYLDEAMALFKKEDYKSALKKYRTIIKTYPDDVNAHFYGGLAYHNLNRQKKAAHFLSIAEKHDLAVFTEEAQFYRAMSLIRSGKSTEASFVLRNIVDKESFYSQRARELLRDLK